MVPCCRTCRNAAAVPEGAWPLQCRKEFDWTLAMIQSQNPLRFSSLSLTPPKWNSLVKPTGTIKVFVKPGRRNRELPKKFRGCPAQVPWRCGHWWCWGQGSSTGSPLQSTHRWKLWAVQTPVLPLGTLRSPASCQRPKITQVLCRVELFQDSYDLALLRFASFPNKNKNVKSWNSLKTMGKYNFCSGFKFYFNNTKVYVLMQTFEKT